VLDNKYQSHPPTGMLCVCPPLGKVATEVAACLPAAIPNAITISINIIALLLMTMTEIERDLEDAGNKIKAGAKAVWNKTEDLGRDLDAEYRKEKLETGPGVRDDLEEAGDKLKAGAKAVANKVKDTSRDLDAEYEKEKSLERGD